VNELLQSDGLMRRLRQGAPLDLDVERVRLPRFTDIREIDQKDLGQKGKEPLIVARSRTATWALWPVAKRSSFEVRDAEHFLKIVASIQAQHPEKPVKGYVLTQGPISNDSRAKLAAGGHVVSTIVGATA
jgi:hypothetical protein